MFLDLPDLLIIDKSCFNNCVDQLKRSPWLFVQLINTVHCSWLRIKLKWIYLGIWVYVRKINLYVYCFRSRNLRREYFQVYWALAFDISNQSQFTGLSHCIVTGWTYGKLMPQESWKNLNSLSYRHPNVNSKLCCAHCLLLLFLCSSCVLRTRLSKLWSRLTHRRSPALLAYYGPAIVKHCASESNDNLYKINLSSVQMFKKSPGCICFSTSL